MPFDSTGSAQKIDLSSSDVRAVILAGGKGTRLRPLTAVFPKPLVPLGDKAVLEILLRQLRAQGFKKVTLCTGYLAEMIMVLCGRGEKFGLDIHYSKEPKPLGTVGPLGFVDELTNPFMVANGDLLTTMDFNRMLAFHSQQKADITIGTYRRDVKIDFGVVQTDAHGRFKGFSEKPRYHFEVSMGINVLNPSVLQYITPGRHMDMPDLIMKVHEDGGRVCCYRENCFWLDIGRMDDYALAQEEFLKNKDLFLGDAS
jgi:NDP-sugar pyrophosphorylase family protein